MYNSPNPSSSGMEKWYNHDVVVLENDEYIAKIIPDIGANCIVMRDKIKRMELVRSPSCISDLEIKPEVYGIPILFLPNRIDAGKIITESKIYELPVTEAAGTYLHGFLHKSRWSVVDCWTTMEEAHTVLMFTHCSKMESFYCFPHKFTVVVQYMLSKTGLTQVVKFTNEDCISFPFAIGCHTALRLPAESSKDWSSCRLLLSARKRWELDCRHLPTGKVYEIQGQDLDLLKDGLKVSDEKISALFSSGSIQIGKHEFNGAILSNAMTGYTIEYTVDPSYRFWVLWNGGGGQGFVCPEPQTWAVNAPNLELSKEETGMRLIHPGEVVTLTSRLCSGTFHIH